MELPNQDYGKHPVQDWSENSIGLPNLDVLGFSHDLRRRRLTHCCTGAWPQYQLDNRSRRPPEGTFDYQILMDLDNLCRHQGKWSEVPYIQASWDLRSWPSLRLRCSPTQVLLARTPPPDIPPTNPKDLDSYSPSPLSESPENLTSSHRLGPAAPPPPPYPEPNAVPPTPSPPAPPPPRPPLRSPPAQISPDTVGPCLPLAGGAEKRLGSFSASPGNYIKEFQCLAQACDLTWHHLPVVQTTTLTPEERAQSAAAREHADQARLPASRCPWAPRRIPEADPGSGSQRRIPDGITRPARRAADAGTAWGNASWRA